MHLPVRPPAIPDDASIPHPPPLPARGSGARLWLARHAQVHADWAEKAYGCLDVPLSEHGQRQTVELAASFARLDVSEVRSSNLSRALALGRAITAATGAPLTVDEGLREVSRGDWQGLPAAEFRARWEAQRAQFLADPWRWKGHGGESDEEVFARAWPAIEAGLEQVAGGTLVVASHFNVIRSVVTRLLGLSAAQSFGFRTDTAHATLLLDAPEGWRVLTANCPDPGGVPLPA